MLRTFFFESGGKEGIGEGMAGRPTLAGFISEVGGGSGELIIDPLQPVELFPAAADALEKGVEGKL